MGIRLDDRTAGRDPARAHAREERPERWLVPPRLRTMDETGDRHASWLELFFDLVFVVAITELSSQLVHDHSAAGFLRFAGLFVPVFVAWQGYMAYATRFDTDDLGFRVAYFAAMLAIAAMAVLIDDVARGVHSAAFAAAYAVLRSLMLALYWRAWRAVPEARPLIRFYGLGYSAGVSIWLVSIAVPTPDRYVLWGAALVLELSLPPLSTQLHRRIPTSASHLPSYAHIPLLLALAAVSSGLRLLIDHAGDSHLDGGASVALLGGVVVYLVSLVATRSVTIAGPWRRGVSLKLAAVALIAGLVALQPVAPPLALAGALAAILCVVVFAERTLISPASS